MSEFLRRIVDKVQDKDPTEVTKRLRNASRDSSLWRDGGVRVNDFLWYDTGDAAFPNQLGLHLFRVGEKLSQRKRAMQEYISGLDMLAERLKANDPEFRHVAHVCGWSNVVYDNRPFLQRLGFEIRDIDDENGQALAIMPRQKFIEKPWKKGA